MDVVAWLLGSDPAVRWQAMRDLTDASTQEIEDARARVPYEGLGELILLAQGADGPWHLPEEPDWLPTLFSMVLLRTTGAPPADPAVRAAIEKLENGYRWDIEFGAKPFFAGEVEACINGHTLGCAAYFGKPDEPLARRLLGDQRDDGGWNCDDKSRRSSFHSTICVLEGLLEYELAIGGSATIADARQRGEEYLLERALFRRKTTGAVVFPDALRLAFPTRYRYDVLRALDYFRAAGRAPDPRTADALRHLEERKTPDGRWHLDRAHEESIAFTCGETVGQPSAWNTLRALRVMRWARS